MKILKNFMTVFLAVICICLGGICLTQYRATQTEGTGKKLPPPAANETSTFFVDANINMETIDEWLFRDDVAYRDVRMLFDPADYEKIGGDADLSATVEGFKIVPYPYIGSLQTLPVGGGYEGKHLFEISWASDGRVESALPLYEESMPALNALFPKDKAIFLMCGGGGYAGMMKELLLYLGWDENKLYNIGGQWEYEGSHSVELKLYPDDKNLAPIYASWKADYTYLEFDKMSEISEKSLQEYHKMLAEIHTDEILNPLKPGVQTDGGDDHPGGQAEEFDLLADGDFPVFTFSHYSSGGTREAYKAVILFEQSNQSFTAYQIAFPSCTCRDALVNYYSVCYVEILNSKRSSQDAAIRNITFRNNQGLYGDSNPNYYIAEYTEDYMHEHLIDKLIGCRKEDFEAFSGYGSYIDAIDADAVSGATVTSSNLQSMLKSLFVYHTKKYYQE